VLINRVADFLDSCYAMRSEMVPLLIGEPGIGKTQGVYEFAANKNVKVVELYLSQMSPLEISGMTMPNEQDHSMQVFDSKRLDSLEDGDILFLDELFQAPQQTLAACLTLIQERRMLSGKMLPDIFIVAAANPVEYGYKSMPLSIRQRFMAVSVKSDNNLVKEYIKDRVGISLTLAEVSSLLNNFDTIGFNKLTPRSLVKLLKYVKEMTDEDKVREFVTCLYSSSTADYILSIWHRYNTDEDRNTILNLVNDLDIDAAKFIRENFDSMSISELLRTLNDEELLEAIGDEMKKISLRSKGN